MTTYNAYDPFAWIYNKHWGYSFLPVIMPVLENMVLRRLSRRAHILDLCCGTGQLAEKLSAMGYRVTGLDGSAQMLEYARENAPAVEFVQADARTFALPGKFSAVISAFDSLNHIMKMSDLEQVFARVYDSLKPGGVFLFDLNTTEGFKQEWQGDFNIIEDDQVCIVVQKYDPVTRVAVYDVTTFRLKDNGWYRADFKLLQKNHDISRVKTALIKAGFEDIEVSGFDWMGGLRPLTPDARRAFLMCRKPA
ncbi:MAG: class I SAM-dependent methyltransferase [Dehalococcoidales bacterium]|nr:class I SAM-dependent methyltransferase [Dehalococcoidales bacterium]